MRDTIIDLRNMTVTAKFNAKLVVKVLAITSRRSCLLLAFSTKSLRFV